MSATIGDRLNRLKVMLNVVVPLVEIDDKLLIHFIEMSRDQCWRTEVKSVEFLFRTTATLASDDDLPADYVSYANNATYTTGGATYPFKYIEIKEIGSVKTNTYGQLTATNPGLWFSDGKLRTFPSALTGITFEYVKKPQTFLGQALTTQDDMPQYTEASIVRGAFERALLQILDESNALKLSQAQLAEVQDATKRYYDGFFENQLRKVGMDSDAK